MSGTDRRGFLGLLLAAAALPGCTEVERIAREATRPPAEGGIGGTGIVGVLTGLGSLLLAGERVALPADAAVEDAFGPYAPERLKPGQSLTVEATGAPGALVATRVRLVHPVIGPIERVSGDGRSLTVGGVAVRLGPEVQSLGQRGMRAAVSGLWDGTEVVASRIDLPLPEGPDVVAGVVRAGPAGPEIGGLRIAPGGATVPEAGRFATVTGTIRGGAIAADRIVEGRFGTVPGGLARLLVEGYLEPVAEAPFFRVSGLGHSFDRAAEVGVLTGTRALFIGPYTGDFAVERAVVLPEGIDGRRDVLAPGGRYGGRIQIRTR